jgi:hypothetical protein
MSKIIKQNKIYFEIYLIRRVNKYQVNYKSAIQN